MRVRTISYQKAFVIGAYLQEKIGVEVELDEHDDWNEALEDAKELVNKWGSTFPDISGFNNSTIIEHPHGIQVIPSIDPNKKDTLEKINDATSQHELDLLMGDAAKYGLAKELNEKKRKLLNNEQQQS